MLCKTIKVRLIINLMKFQKFFRKKALNSSQSSKIKLM